MTTLLRKPKSHWLALTLLLLGSCQSNDDHSGADSSPPNDSPNDGGDGSPAQPSDAGDGSSEAGAGEDASPPEIPNENCPKVVSFQLQARKAVTSEGADPDPDTEDRTITITKGELYRDFIASCGTNACHAGANKPLEQSPNPFKFTESSFGQRPGLGTQALDRILNDDAAKVMPPGSGDGSKRRDDDPIRVLGQQLKAWQEAGFADQFEITVEAPSNNGSVVKDPYLLASELGRSLTNIGSCVPVAALEQRPDEMQPLDQMFASAQSVDDLPETLVETDLVSLNSEVLARRGVFSYAPTYTLFSDNAEKMRYVRIPAGHTISYDEASKDFDIPENTRFYKTFLRKVIDKDGEVGYRKMETRLIVSRNNEQLPDGTFRPRALRVVYAWDKDEQMARKVKDPLRNGESWADRLCPYVTDEQTPRDPEKNPIIERVSSTCTYMTDEELEDPSSGKIRHYAIPSIERCDQCHMGSSSRSYILGFSPWQADRRPREAGGVFEEPHESELSQLRRLIDYGVISGIKPGQAKLEESQGARKPRNDFELTAQGYMLGNCAFCHNPNGFPTVQNPVLAPFDMFPSETGGIFQFPLEKFSPRAKHGLDQQVRYPYITPAFGNHEATGEGSNRSKKQFAVGELSPVIDLNTGVNPAGTPIWVLDRGVPDVQYNRFNIDPVSGAPFLPVFNFLAPWRSLIWRNVYTPFTYSEDSTIFIHMPRNVPGFDCRAHKIMASWMLSIPSKDCRHLVATDPAPVCPQKAALVPGQQSYNLDQPFEEVLPGSDEYEKAVAAALERVEDYQNGVTGQHCPDDTDIVDPQVVRSPYKVGTELKVQPAPIDVLGKPPNSPRAVSDPTAWNGISDSVPDHAHWVPVDTTDALQNGWSPRRSNWKAVLVERSVPVSPQLDAVIESLQTLHLTEEQRAFSEKPLPMGLWHPDCRQSELATSSPTVAELQVKELQRLPNNLGDLQRWVLEPDQDDNPLPPLAPVHSQSRGEVVFRAICQNCHGKSADSKSPLAATIYELTGGETRVANFVDGIFGPKPAPGLFAEDEFRINRGATPADWQVRYMLFMGLGGTESTIPEIAISLVSTSPFYGKAVRAGQASGANMLEAASGKCNSVLNALWQVDQGMKVKLKDGLFLRGTAEYDLWESLCGFQNIPVVRVLEATDRDPILFTTSIPILYRAQDDSGAWIYPPDHPVGNRTGKVQLGIRADNYLPWCVRPNSIASREQLLQRFATEGIPESLAPICPSTLFATAFGGKEIYRIQGDNAFDNSAFVKRVTQRGAMNSGMAAYYYLNGITKGTITPTPAYDACKEQP